MWEAINANKWRSRLLISGMLLLLLSLGGIIGAYYIGAEVEGYAGWQIGMALALVVWFVQWLIAMFGGNSILLSMAGAEEISKADSPRLFNCVEEMTIAAGLPKPPRVFLVNDSTPNAFAVGRTPDNAAVAATTGLLERLTRDELQGVVAHEVAHIKNLDTRFLTLAAVYLGSITMLSELVLRNLTNTRRRTRHRSSSSSSSGNGQVQLILLAVLLAAVILAPLFAQMLYFACSRRREFLADASAALFTRFPAGLAGALEKISVANSGVDAPGITERARPLLPMYIVNPLDAAGGGSLFSTHPPIADRVKVLRGMAGASFVEYDKVYRSLVGGEKRGVIGEATLREATQQGDPGRRDPSEPEPARIESQGAGPAMVVGGAALAASRVRHPGETGSARKPYWFVGGEDRVAQRSESLDWAARSAGYLTVDCSCGLRIRTPPGFTGETVACPKCKRVHGIPRAGAGTTEEPLVARPWNAPDPDKVRMLQPGESVGPYARLQYTRRRPGQWESFQCACGKTLHLGPVFAAPQIRCGSCRKLVHIA